MPRMRSEGTGCRLGEVGAPERVSRACPWRRRARVAKCSRSGELGYHGKAETNEVAASQSATHSPSDKRDIPIQDATLISRGCGRAGLQPTIE